MANQMGFKKVYLLAPNYQAGKDAMAGFKRFFKGEVVNEVFTQVNQPDYSVELAALADARPDAAYVFFPGGMGVNFVSSTARPACSTRSRCFRWTPSTAPPLPALQKDALGAVTNVPYSPDLDNAANKAFAAAFRQYGREPSSYAAQSWDAAQLIGSALRAPAARSTTRTRCARRWRRPTSPRFAANSATNPITSRRLASSAPTWRRTRTARSASSTRGRSSPTCPRSPTNTPRNAR